MTERSKKYLSDIIIAIGLIEDFIVETPDYSTFVSDKKTKSAVERQ